MATNPSTIPVELFQMKEALKMAPQVIKVVTAPPPKPKQPKQASSPSKSKLGVASTSSKLSSTKPKDRPQMSPYNDFSSSSHPT